MTRMAAGRAGLRWAYIVLAGLLGVFLFRVAAQFVQWVYPLPLLPRFERWSSGALPYPLLLVGQLVLLGVGAQCVRMVGRGMRFRLSRWPDLILGLGGVYLFVMLARLGIGLSLGRDWPWFDHVLPAIFHLCLAVFCLVFGWVQGGSWKNAARRLSYPGIILAGVAAFMVAVASGVGPGLASTAVVIIAALVITGLERQIPYRRGWSPVFAEVRTDVAYLIFVQKLLPWLLGLWSVSLASQIEAAHGLVVNPWPQHWPVVAQALLMMVTAEFFRYWLHRLSHNWRPLWALHAVHHSAKKLNWVNVGRFHPLEKSLQFLFDACPFIVLGVSNEVLGLYFVFYAINGFFQHSNVDVRLGFLNYIISGPELHRWHHSRIAEESNHNYGNNLIVWDWVFGSRYLPPDRAVAELGLINRQYPATMGGQLVAPFFLGLDKKPRSQK